MPHKQITFQALEGMQTDRGYLSPHFVSSMEKMEAVLDDPLIRPGSFVSVGQWYQEFEEISDAEVTDLLTKACHRHYSPPCIA